jgi:hypothetical protein
MLKIGWKGCPYCGDHEAYRSRTEPLTRLDRACRFFLLQLVRCYECELRHYRPIFFSVPESPNRIGGEKRARMNVDDEPRELSA